MANIFKNSVTKNLGTTPVEVYSTGNRVTSTVIGINIANTSTSNIEADIILKTSDQTELYIVKGCPINRNSALAAMGGDQKLVMEPNSTLILRTNKDNSSDAVISTLEITS